MKDNKVSNKELLVAKSNKGYRKIYGWVWYMLEDKELYRSTSRETDGKWNARDIRVKDDRLYLFSFLFSLFFILFISYFET